MKSVNWRVMRRVFFAFTELIQELLCMRDIIRDIRWLEVGLQLPVKNVSSSPHGREPWILDSTPWISDFRFQVLDSRMSLPVEFKSLMVFQTPWALCRIPQAKISQISNFLTWGDKQLGTTKKQTHTTQTNSAIWRNIVQPPNGQLSQFCVRRPLKSSPSGGVSRCTFCPLFLKFDTRTKIH